MHCTLFETLSGAHPLMRVLKPERHRALHHMPVADLVAMAEDVQLGVSGTKADLIQRIRAFDAQEAARMV